MAGAKRLSDGNTRLDWVPSIANVSAPTLTELGAGSAVPLSDKVSANNYTFGAAASDTIDDPALSANSNSKGPGRSNYEAGFDFFRYVNSVDDVAWATFVDKGQHGYLVERRGKPSATAWEAGDEVTVMEVLTDSPQLLSASANSYDKFRVAFFAQDKVDLRATVVTS